MLLQNMQRSYHYVHFIFLLLFISLQTIVLSQDRQHTYTKRDAESNQYSASNQTPRSLLIKEILGIEKPSQTPVNYLHGTSLFDPNTSPPSFIMERVAEFFNKVQMASKPVPNPYAEIANNFVHKAERILQSHNDGKTALYYFRLAAIFGHQGARAAAGALLLSGEFNVPRNVSSGVIHLRAAANKGQPDAQALLGMLHASGIADRNGIEKSLPKALVYWTFAAASGNTYASTALGFRHLHGLGLPKSCTAAVHYYHHVAHAIATDERFWPTPYKFVHGPPPIPSGLMVTDRVRLDEATLSGSHDALELDSEVLQYYHHSANREDTFVRTTLGAMYYFGYGVPPDENRAREELQRAADLHNAEAHGLLGHLKMREGKNHSAIMHFRHAAATNNRIGHYALGMIYLHGLLGMEQDYAKAEMHFQLTLEGNLHTPKVPNAQYAGAAFELGMLYWRGVTGKFSIEKAIGYFQDAATHDHLQAKLKMGQILLQRKTPINSPSCEMAVEYLKDVAERGEWNNVFEMTGQNIGKKNWYSALYRQLQAAHVGIEIAQYNAAIMLETMDKSSFPELEHWDRQRMLNEAHELYQLSGTQGHTDSLVRSGNAFYSENNNYKQAANIYSQAASMKSGEGMVALGLMYARGLGVSEDRQQALRYFQSAAHLDQDSATPASIARVGLSIFWALNDFWTWLHDILGGFEEKVSYMELPSPNSNKIQHVEGMQRPDVSKIMRSRPFFDFSSDALIIVLLLIALLVVLLMRGQRMARQPNSTDSER